MKHEPDLRGGWTIAYHSSPHTLEAGWYIRPTNGSPPIGAFMTQGQANNEAVAIACENRRHDDEADQSEHEGEQ